MKFNFISDRGVRFLTGLCLYYCMLSGVLSICIRRNRLIYSRWLQIYTLLHNAIMLCCMPVYVTYALRQRRHYGTKSVAFDTNAVKMLLRSVIILLTILTRWQRERHLIRTVVRLNALELRYFQRLLALITPRQTHRLKRDLNAMMYAKVFVMLNYMLTMSVSVLRYGFAAANWWTMAAVLFTIGTVNIVNSATFHYYLALWHICGRFRVLNERVRQIMQAATVRRLSARESVGSLATELRDLSCAHAQLVALLQRLTHTYRRQLFCMVLTYFVNNASTAYFAVVAVSMDKHGQLQSDAFARILSCVIFVILFCDMLLFDSLCEHTANAANDTLLLLRDAAVVRNADECIVQSCNAFALQLTRENVRIRIFGMFDINKRNTFAVLAHIQLYAIFLIQADFEHLRRQEL